MMLHSFCALLLSFIVVYSETWSLADLAFGLTCCSYFIKAGNVVLGEPGSMRNIHERKLQHILRTMARNAQLKMPFMEKRILELLQRPAGVETIIIDLPIL